MGSVITTNDPQTQEGGDLQKWCLRGVRATLPPFLHPPPPSCLTNGSSSSGGKKPAIISLPPPHLRALAWVISRRGKERKKRRGKRQTALRQLATKPQVETERKEENPQKWAHGPPKIGSNLLPGGRRHGNSELLKIRPKERGRKRRKRVWSLLSQVLFF